MDIVGKYRIFYTSIITLLCHDPELGFSFFPPFFLCFSCFSPPLCSCVCLSLVCDYLCVPGNVYPLCTSSGPLYSSSWLHWPTRLCGMYCIFRPFCCFFLAQAFSSNFFVLSWHFTNWISPLLQVQTSQSLSACFSHLYYLSFFTMTYSATVVFTINPVQLDHLSLPLLVATFWWI